MDVVALLLLVVVILLVFIVFLGPLTTIYKKFSFKKPLFWTGAIVMLSTIFGAGYLMHYLKHLKQRHPADPRLISAIVYVENFRNRSNRLPNKQEFEKWENQSDHKGYCCDCSYETYLLDKSGKFSETGFPAYTISCFDGDISHYYSTPPNRFYIR